MPRPRNDETQPLPFAEMLDIQKELREFRKEFADYKLAQATNKDLQDMLIRLGKVETEIEFYKWLSRLAVGGVIVTAIGLVFK